MHLRLIESQASVTLCNTTDHAFERFMPVPVTRNTKTNKGRNVHAFMCAQDMTLVGIKNLQCIDLTPMLGHYVNGHICTHKHGRNMAQETKSCLLTDYEVTYDKIGNF